MGTRNLPFSWEIYIEGDDFMEDPPKKFFRLVPRREVRLKHAYYITCKEAVKDPASGEITELRCTYDPETRGGWSKDKRKVKGTFHWVSTAHALRAQVRIYEHLFTKEYPSLTGTEESFTDHLNPDSLKVLENCMVEPGLGEAKVEERFQFLRKGYYVVDNQDSALGALVFNQIVTLKDTWKKIHKKQKK